MKIIQATPRQPYVLELCFDNGATGLVDLSPLVGRGVFAIWNESGAFEKVRVTREGTVEWPGEVDLCPDALYMQMTGKSVQEMFADSP